MLDYYDSKIEKKVQNNQSLEREHHLKKKNLGINNDECKYAIPDAIPKMMINFFVSFHSGIFVPFFSICRISSNDPFLIDSVTITGFLLFSKLIGLNPINLSRDG